MESLDPSSWPSTKPAASEHFVLRCQNGFLETSHPYLIDGTALLQDVDEAA